MSRRLDKARHRRRHHRQVRTRTRKRADDARGKDGPTMKLFNHHDLPSAVAHATRGDGQALWLDSQLGVGHLFDQDTERLRKTVVALGVREVVISQVGEPRQAAMLQGTALKRAVAVAEAGERFIERIKGVGDA